jgi:HEAT repeat protein
VRRPYPARADRRFADGNRAAGVCQHGSGETRRRLVHRSGKGHEVVRQCPKAIVVSPPESPTSRSAAEGRRRVTRLKRERDVEGLIAELGSSEEGMNYTVREAAAIALAHLGAREAVGPLLGLLSDDDKGEVRAVAAGSLGRIGERSAVPALVKALVDPSPVVQKTSLHALARLSPREAVAPLIAFLDSAEPHTRRWAARWLGQLGDRAAIEPLQRARARESLIRRRTFTRALRSIEKSSI